MPTIIHFSSSGSLEPSGRGPRGPRGRAQTIALAVTALAAGAVLLAFGLVLLAGLAAVGVVVGGGVALYHRLTGRWPGLPRTTRGTAQIDGLDPMKEVFSAPARRLPAPGAEPDGRGAGREGGGE